MQNLNFDQDLSLSFAIVTSRVAIDAPQPILKQYRICIDSLADQSLISIF